MDMALGLLVQAETMNASDDVAGAKQTALLTEALKFLREEPANKAYQGHLSLGIQQTATALDDLGTNKPSSEVHKVIGLAVAQVQAAVTALQSDVSLTKSSIDVPAGLPTPTRAPKPPPPPPKPSYLKNSDLSEGWVGWHGDGEVAFLKADGTEGAEDDKDVTRVIKIVLSRGQSREVYQEYDTLDNPPRLNFYVDVFASSDFKRSTFKSDYTIDWEGNASPFWWYIVIPNVDFWIRVGPTGATGYKFIMHNLKPGAWTAVGDHSDLISGIKNRVINFCVPLGEGTVYLKNPSVRP